MKIYIPYIRTYSLIVYSTSIYSAILSSWSPGLVLRFQEVTRGTSLIQLPPPKGISRSLFKNTILFSFQVCDCRPVHSDADRLKSERAYYVIFVSPLTCLLLAAIPTDDTLFGYIGVRSSQHVRSTLTTNSHPAVKSHPAAAIATIYSASGRVGINWGNAHSPRQVTLAIPVYAIAGLWHQQRSIHLPIPSSTHLSGSAHSHNHSPPAPPS